MKPDKPPESNKPNGPVRVDNAIIWGDGRYREMTWRERAKWRLMKRRKFRA